MAKYTLMLIFLAFWALSNSSIYSWTYWSSNDKIDLSYAMDKQQHYLQNYKHHNFNQAPRHRSKHRHRNDTCCDHCKHHGKKEKKNEDMFALQRHMRRKSLHLQNQAQYRRIYEQTHQKQTNNFSTIPRILQHLNSIDDHMYGDAPDNNNIKTKNLLENIPSQIISNKNYDGGVINIEDYVGLLPTVGEVLSPQLVCPKCENRHKVEHITAEELTRLRIEFVKQQILEKLRLKVRPNVSAIGLPKPIYEGTTILQGNDKTKNKELDDYYARTNKKFIFLEREHRECNRLGPHNSMCFSFKIEDADADGFEVSTAILWIFKNKHIKSTLRSNAFLQQQTIVVSEVQQQNGSKFLPKVKPIAIQSVDVQGEWMKIDIEWPIKRWFGNHDLSHLIHISCQSCEIISMDEMISTDKDYRPFIMFNTQNRRYVSRRKRSVNCTVGVTECCREKLYISFDDIGWGDWIIQPRGYDAYFCRGNCGSLASVTEISSPHTSFLQKVISANKYIGKPLELIPCCTSKQYSSLQLVFMDSNHTATLKTFPNMVVESCGCR